MLPLITHDDIKNWGKTHRAKGDFPFLVSNLVIATTPNGTFVDFPTGSATFIEGWDGKVECGSKTSYVPEGSSRWEFGTQSKGITGKAQEDYDKRKGDPLGDDPKKCTFIFVTPHIWSDKDQWAKDCRAEGFWFDVKAYDIRDLAQWLQMAPAVAQKFAEYTGKIPKNELLYPQVFWDEYKTGPKGMTLPPGSVTAGREQQSLQIAEFLAGDAGIKAVRASSQREAIAFIISTAMQFEKSQQENFFARALIIESVDAIRSVYSTKNPLILITKFEDLQPLHKAAGGGHHVLVPLGPDDDYNSADIITLPQLDKSAQINWLIATGMNPDVAERYSRESGRNITILKKLLGWPQDKLEWSKPENAAIVIPALLLGRWDETKKGDTALLEKLSGEKYDSYINKISRWKDSSDPLFIQIGSFWRLVSPMDAWTNLSRSLTKQHLENLEQAFLETLINNPVVEHQNELKNFSFASKEYLYSKYSREGLTQSLVLVSLYGNKLELPGIPSSQSWVDNVIRKLLGNATASTWTSLNHLMPLLAEASPESFLEAVDLSLAKADMPIMNMFKEEPGFLTPTSNHTGLLWALESIAWLPEYFGQAALTLAKLSSIDPGGHLSNRPINSLREILKPWHYQTIASFEDRINALKLIAQKYNIIGWDLLVSLLPEKNNVAFPTNKLRWRMFEQSSRNNITWDEIWDTHSAIVDILLSIFDYTEKQLASLIEESVTLTEEDRKKVQNFVELSYDKVFVVKNNPWKALRHILHHHRSHPKSEWALPKAELEWYEKMYEAKVPSDVIAKNIWMFDDSWPRFPEGFVYESNSHEVLEKLILKKKIEGLTEIYKTFGVKKIVELSLNVEHPYSLGDALAHIISKSEEIISVCQALDQGEKAEQFAKAFVARMGVLNGTGWGIEWFEKLKQAGFNNKNLAHFLLPLKQTIALWSFIRSVGKEIYTEYWLHIHPQFYYSGEEELRIGMEELIRFKRFATAIYYCRLHAKDIPSKIILELLEKTAKEEASEEAKLQSYEIMGLFEVLDERNDVDEKQLVQLEWYYIHFIASYGSIRKPKLLHKELSQNPEFFDSVLRVTYKSDNDEQNKKEIEGLSEETLRTRSLHGYELLHSWKKIPGMDNNGKIDGEFLWNWIKKVRELASQSSRLEIADLQIGKMLAQYNESAVDSPPEIICEILESINSDAIFESFHSELFNKRGMSSRGPYEGGNIERGHAKYFLQLADKVKSKFPKVAKVYRDLAKGYERDAKAMDERAERDKLEY